MRRTEQPPMQATTSMSLSLPARTDSLPCVVIIGADAVLDARPATPVQLAHACLAAGYVAAIPASWGDELVARACVRRLASRGDEPTIFCACPRVRDRLLASGEELVPWLVSLVAPPVAAARYVRSLFPPDGVLITYVGGCPGASDNSIDQRADPTTFLSALAARDIVASDQPTLFDSVLPP